MQEVTAELEETTAHVLRNTVTAEEQRRGAQDLQIVRCDKPPTDRSTFANT